MQIKLDDKLILTSDNNGYQISEYKIAEKDTENHKKGDILKHNTRYYGTLESALRIGFAERKIRESTAETLVELRQDIRRVEEKVDRLIGELYLA